VLLINAAFHRPLFESFLFAVALAVGLTPELLPMVLSVTLSQGAMRLARRNVIVKRLSAVQELGGIDVLTDKTGTSLKGTSAGAPRRCSGPRQRACAGTRLPQQPVRNRHPQPAGRGDPSAHHIDVSAWHKIDEVPFDFERRRVSVLLDRADERTLIVKGRPKTCCGCAPTMKMRARFTPWTTGHACASRPCSRN